MLGGMRLTQFYRRRRGRQFDGEYRIDHADHPSYPIDATPGRSRSQMLALYDDGAGDSFVPTDGVRAFLESGGGLCKKLKVLFVARF